MFRVCPGAVQRWMNDSLFADSVAAGEAALSAQRRSLADFMRLYLEP